MFGTKYFSCAKFWQHNIQQNRHDAHLQGVDSLLEEKQFTGELEIIVKYDKKIQW